VNAGFYRDVDEGEVCKIITLLLLLLLLLLFDALQSRADPHLLNKPLPFSSVSLISFSNLLFCIY